MDAERIEAIRERAEILPKFDDGHWSVIYLGNDVSVGICISGGCTHPEHPEPPFYEPIVDVWKTPNGTKCPPDNHALAEFFAHSGLDIPDLLSHVDSLLADRERLAARVAELEGAIEKHERSFDFEGDFSSPEIELWSHLKGTP